MIQLVRDGVRWHCEPGFAPQLDRLLADRGVVTRESHAKLITKHGLDGVVYYIKHYVNDAVAGRPLKYFFKPSPARDEWENARRIEAEGVPIVRHLAYGERWSWKGLLDSILITEGFDALTLVDTPLQQAPEAQAALGRFLRLNHDRGVLQRDLQRNILVRSNPLEIRRVDVCHAVIKPELSEVVRRENLAFLNATVPLQDEFFAAYGWSPAQAALTRERSEEIRRARHHSRSERCLKRNSEFSARRIGGLKWHVRNPFYDARLATLLENPDRWLRERETLFKGFDRASTVGAANGLVLKRYNFRKPINLFKDLFRRSPAIRSYRKALHLELVGIDSPRPIAAAERRCCRLLTASYLVVEEIQNAQHLGQYLAGVPRVDRSLVIRLAELVGRLHNEGFSHRDLKETNIVLDAAQKPFLIDLDGLEFLTRIPEARAAANLARLARASISFASVSRADRVAFLRHYCRVRGLRHVPRTA